MIGKKEMRPEMVQTRPRITGTVNQSEISVIFNQPIRYEYYFESTNQSRVLTCFSCNPLSVLQRILELRLFIKH